MRKRTFFIIGMMAAMFATEASAQEVRREAYVMFRVGSGTLEKQYEGNSEKLDSLVGYLKETLATEGMTLKSVEFRGSASPEGRYARNHYLSDARMASLESYVRSRVELPQGTVVRNDRQIAWEYLAALVETSDLAGRDEVLRIIREVPEFAEVNGTLIEKRQQELMKLNGGAVWREMNRCFFGKLRNACAVVVTYRQEPPAPVVEETPQPAVRDTVEVVRKDTVVVTEVVEADSRKPFYMAAKTNLLYDALLVPNIGVEFYLGKDWSLSANWMYAWWKTDKRHRYWRTYGGELEARKWFGSKAAEKPLTGHHVGVYLQGLTYDVELGGTGYLSYFSYGAGVSYGYSLPVAKRLNLDFVIGVGYFGGEYKEYEPIDTHYVWQATKNRHWFGPTKAEISLVWLIGHGNKNIKKGGDR